MNDPTTNPINDLILAVGELLMLKDGPRDSMYYQLKPGIWNQVRKAHSQIVERAPEFGKGDGS